MGTHEDLGEPFHPLYTTAPPEIIVNDRQLRARLERPELCARIRPTRGEPSLSQDELYETADVEGQAWREFAAVWWKMGLHGRQRLFCTLRGSPIKSAYVRVLLPRLARKAGIEKRVHAHALRHTHAAELMREGVPLNLIQRQLGHRSVATTSRYLDHLQPQEVVDAMQKRDWSL